MPSPGSPGECLFSDQGHLPPVDPLAAEDVPARREVHPEDHPDAEQDEGDRPSLQVPAGQRAGHGR